MTIKYKKWKNHLSNFSKLIDDAKIKFVKTPSLGLAVDFITAEIYCSTKHGKDIVITQSVVAGHEDASVSFLTYQYLFNSSFHLNLTIYQSDFFDKLFAKRRIKTGNVEFDKIYTIKSTNCELGEAIFKNENVQKIFLSNPLLMFKIEHKKGEIIIEMKNLNKKMYLHDEMLYFFKEFNSIVELTLHKISGNTSN